MKQSGLKIFINLLLLAGFTALTLLFQKSSQMELESTQQQDKQLAVLKSMRVINQDLTADSLQKLYAQKIRWDEINGRTVYRIKDRNQGPVAFEVRGQSLYGEVKGIVSVDEEMNNLLKVSIYKNAASPGYGRGALNSPEWLGRLSEQPLFPPPYQDVDYKRKEKSVDGLTGASLKLKAASRFNSLFYSSIVTAISGGTDLVPLEMDFSVDAITRATPGYPRQQVKPPHLKAEIQRPAFLVPPGTKLLSKGKPVTSSMELEPIIGELAQITDGIKTSTEFDYVELDMGPQWIQIDLRDIYTIYLVAIWHYYKNPVIYRDVIVQLSRDDNFRKGVRTIYNNDHDNSAGLGAGADSAYYARWWGEFADARGPAFRGTPARFVRVYTNGGTGQEDTRFVEVEVYGK